MENLTPQIEEDFYKIFPQITYEMNRAIINFLKKVEDYFKISIIFACDTGSRTTGVAVENSDCDINGFFIRKSYDKFDSSKNKKILTKHHVTPLIKESDKFAKAYDIQIWDLDHWILSKKTKNMNSNDYWFYSPLIYINEIPELIGTIKAVIKPPLNHFYGKFWNNFAMYADRKKIKEGVENKKIMNTLIYGIEFLYAKLFYEFPEYNIFNLIKKINSNKDFLLSNYLLTHEEYLYLTKCFEYIYHTYEEKKKNKKSMTYELPLCVKKFMYCLKKKYQENIEEMKECKEDRKEDRNDLEVEIISKTFENLKLNK
jgi:predicted nucleotidyltransferase